MGASGSVVCWRQRREVRLSFGETPILYAVIDDSVGVVGRLDKDVATVGRLGVSELDGRVRILLVATPYMLCVQSDFSADLRLPH